MLAALLGVPLLICALLGAGADWLVRVLPPAAAVKGLVGASLTAAIASGFVLSVTAFGALAQDPPIARLGGWSASVLHRHEPLSLEVGLAVAGLAGAFLVRAVIFAGRGLQGLVEAERACRDIGPGVDGLIVLDDLTPDAYAVQAYSGRIVLTRGMLAALPADEQRVLLAHERSHLAHRHSLLVSLAGLAGRVNPLLTPVGGAVAFAVERWADEDAAVAIDRDVAARAVARAALCAGRSQTPRRASLAMSAGHAAERVTGLLEAPPQPRRLVAAVLASATILAAASAAGAERSTEQSFQQAHQAALHR